MKRTIVNVSTGAVTEEDVTPEEIAAIQAQIVAAAGGRMDAYRNRVRALRETVLNRLSGIGLAALAGHDNQLVAAVLDARQALLDITACPAVAAATTEEELIVAFLTRWEQIRAAAPIELRSAFAAVSA